jgi:predicted ArsR family transcriptional regulator
MSATKKHHKTIAGEKRAAQILKAIKEAKGEATAISLDVPPSLMTRMLKADLVKIKGKVVSNKRGRPAYKFGLTDKGRKMAAKAN